jgi:secondary thiamine-phosphate synthase enzyme
MRSLSHTLVLQTPGRGLFPCTDAVKDWVATLAASGAGTGLLTLFCRHTSASLLVQENADPDVLADLERFFARLVPDGDSLFRHTAEGPDDMPAHVRAALTQVHLSIPVVEGQLTLGTWQGIYLFEHRRRPHRREVVLQYLGS